MITRTGKVGSRYNTHYYFKQAYLKWEFTSIPEYDDVIISKFTPSKMNYGLNTTITQSFCDGLTVSMYQYFTQESYRSGQIYVRLTAYTTIPEYIKEIETVYYTETIDKLMYNNQSAEFLVDKDKKLKPWDNYSIIHKLINSATYDKCTFTYREGDLGRLIYNLHDKVVVPNIAISRYALEDFYSLDHYVDLLALGTVTTDIYIYFISVNVSSDPGATGLTASDSFSINNSSNFIHSYTTVIAGLKTESFSLSYYPIFMNYALETVAFVSSQEVVT